MQKLIKFYYERRVGSVNVGVSEQMEFVVPDGMTDKAVVHDAYLVDKSYIFSTLCVVHSEEVNIFEKSRPTSEERIELRLSRKKFNMLSDVLGNVIDAYGKQWPERFSTPDSFDIDQAKELMVIFNKQKNK